MTRCVLFDLDGTFADTAPDLHHAMNRLLQREGRPPIDYARFRASVSHGSKAMLRKAFDIAPEDPAFTPLQKTFLSFYMENIADRTRLFDGMESVLAQLDEKAIGWGIVTNKPAYLTDPLMLKLGLAHRACAIVSGDTTAYPKPHPEPILHACRLAEVNPAETIYVGDAARDIEAGRNAGTRTLIAGFGYLSETDNPSEWLADGEIGQPLDLLEWL